MIREVLIFDIKGYAAHFRKFYTNSSSLSYSVPPRTTVSGIIATILGLKRNEYYDQFNVENADIAVRKNNRTRKILQGLNYMKITSKKHFEFPANHTQIPFEIILAEEGLVSYRIYFTSHNESLMDSLEKRLEEKKYYYSPSLGAIPFNSSIDYIGKVKGEIKRDEKVFISSVIALSKVKHRGLEIMDIDEKQVLLVKERMTRDFKSNREIKSVESYIYDENTNGLPVRLNQDYIKLSYDGLEENIIFM